MAVNQPTIKHIKNLHHDYMLVFAIKTVTFTLFLLSSMYKIFPIQLYETWEKIFLFHTESLISIVQYIKVKLLAEYVCKASVQLCGCVCAPVYRC